MIQEQHLGELLVRMGVISAEQLGIVLGRIRSYGGHLASSCLHLGFADERSLAQVVSTQMGVPFAVLSTCALSPSLAKMVPRGTAERMGVLLLQLQGQQLSVAMSQPQNMQAIDELSFGTGCRVTAYGAMDGPLKQSIDAFYRHAELGSADLWIGDAVDPMRLLPAEGIVEIVRPEQKEAQSLDREVLTVATPLGDLVDDWQDEPLYATAHSREDEGQDSSAKRIFVVDDEPDLRRMLTDFFQQQNYIVRSASDGREAMEILKLGLPDLIILDAMLPGVHGFDLCRMLKSSPTTKHIPVVMISAVYRGWRYAEDIKKNYGADAFIEKPFRLDKLLQTVQSQLRGDPPPVDEPGEKAQLLVQRAATAYRLGQTVQALEHLQAAIKVAPFSASLQLKLAHLHEQLGQLHQAVAAYERAAEIQPDEQGLNSLAQLYERQGFVRKALETWERCLWAVTDNARREPIRQHIQRLWQGM